MPKKEDMAPLPPALVCGPCLLIYSIFILFIFLCKYNCKIEHKTKSNGNYTKLTKNKEIWEAIYEIRDLDGIKGANLAWFRSSRDIRGWREFFLMLEILQDNNNVGEMINAGVYPDQYGRLSIYKGAINYCYSKLHLRCW